MDQSALRQSPVAAAEVRQAVRSSGTGDIAQVAAVVLQTDGSLSVIPQSAAGDRSAMTNVQGA
jgi:uncharacterized membrane protein YcaP (DUF421 family)